MLSDIDMVSCLELLPTRIGKLKVFVDKEFDWDVDSVMQAYERLVSHKATGKIVITVPQ